jgi:hypothetical protein
MADVTGRVRTLLDYRYDCSPSVPCAKQTQLRWAPQEEALARVMQGVVDAGLYVVGPEELGLKLTGWALVKIGGVVWDLMEGVRAANIGMTAERILQAERIGSALKDDAAHRAASFLSKEQLMAGKTFPLRGGDGVERTLLQTPGGLNGKNGIYEYILDPLGKVTHQRFILGGSISGIPNQVVPAVP